MDVNQQSESFVELPIDKRAEIVFEALFGLGPMDKRAVTRQVAKALSQSGRLNFKRSKTNLPLGEVIEEAIETALTYGYLDRTKEGNILAVIHQPEDYQPEDWELCLLRSLAIEIEPVTIEDAVKSATRWAVKNLGLTSETEPEENPVSAELSNAVNRLIEASRLELIDGKVIVSSGKTL